VGGDRTDGLPGLEPEPQPDETADWKASKSFRSERRDQGSVRTPAAVPPTFSQPDRAGPAREEDDMNAANPTWPQVADHPFRGRLNAWIFHALDGYADRKYRHVKRELFGGLPHTVLELGAGDGANFRYLDHGTHVIALEPNLHMHSFLRAAAARHHVTVDVRAGVAEHIPLPDGSVAAVIATLVLCTVSDPARALAEIRRVLRPGGRFWCIEHVAAAEGTALALAQRLLRRPWRWLFEGCETQRDTEALLAAGGFASVEVQPFTLRTALVPIRSQIAAVAVR
jgi:SAM-dependent methyltransferase